MTKRYTMGTRYAYGVGYPDAIESAHGEFVRWEDYQALLFLVESIGAGGVGPQPITDEWQLVPKTLTVNMIEAGRLAGGRGMSRHEWLGRIACAWPKMLQAAPKQ